MGFRADVEGLRAVAIGTVLACHAGLAIAPGGFVGVDIFFVISGFLITRLLLAEIEAEGRVSLVRFYARRAKRLLPLVALVLFFVALASYALFSPFRSDRVARDIAASALYVVNWRFAGEAVDYFGPGIEGSPAKHMWSLAVEEQFYFVWPMLLLSATWWWRRGGGDVRRAAWVAVGVVAIASLAYCVVYTSQAPAPAYFSTLARAWELALGAALALLPNLRPAKAPATVLGVGGALAIAYSVVSFSSETAFPGYAALVPTIGAAALIIAGGSSTAPTTKVLSLEPVRYVGRISYAWYLWHWPALVFAQVALGPLSAAQRVAVVAASWIPTELSHRLVERPLRRSPALEVRPARGVALGIGCSALSVACALTLVAAEPSLPTLDETRVEGAKALTSQAQPQEKAAGLRPNPVSPGDDRSAMQDDGCLTKLDETRSRQCVYGNSQSKTTVVLFGDSLAMQYFPALERLARKHDWRLVGLTKAGCPPVDTPVYNHRLEREYRECAEWREATLERIERVELPRLIVVSGRMSTPAIEGGRIFEGAPARARMEEGYVRVLERLRETGASLAAIKDLPRSPRNIPDCVSESIESLDECAFRRTAQNSESFDRRAVSRVRGVRLVDLTPIVCPRGLCRAVIGDALVFRDYDHLTPTFARTLAPFIERLLPRPQ